MTEVEDAEADWGPQQTASYPPEEVVQEDLVAGHEASEADEPDDVDELLSMFDDDDSADEDELDYPAAELDADDRLAESSLRTIAMSRFLRTNAPP